MCLIWVVENTTSPTNANTCKIEWDFSGKISCLKITSISKGEDTKNWIQNKELVETCK